MQNRLDALFKRIARDSAYSAFGAAVFVAKHQQKSVLRRKRKNDVCIKTFLYWDA